jgi:predicted dehydrogenase/threonine dehydrogenase-like Zn-dependent dehydrogenase
LKQLLQSLKTGDTEVADVPAPRIQPGHLLIATTHTLVSAGTERMLVEFGKSNLLRKAAQQPDKVRMVLDKVRADGLAPTIGAVRSKLDQPLALGYCNVGHVIEVGHGVDGFKIGDRVVSNGKHAEFVVVPKNLCARVPDGVLSERAAFVVVAAIGLQGIRLAQPSVGESVAVIGLGLIGLLTVQMLVASGCRVIGLDLREDRMALAREFGAETVSAKTQGDVLRAAAHFTRGHGVDAVLITASTASNEPISQAAKMCRKRGRIVLVGVAGLDISRADFYEKELSFQVSCSYGPGRYDPGYEEGGQDYPYGLVRWTEQRNFEAVLDLLASKRVDPEPLVTHRYALADATEAMRVLSEDSSALGIVLEYESSQKYHDRDLHRTVPLRSVVTKPSDTRPNIAFVGAGGYGGRILIPAFGATDARLHTVISGSGVSAVHHGRRNGFLNASSDEAAALTKEMDAVVIATRHNMHARQVQLALNADKHVFCEKPLCLTLEELDSISQLAILKSELIVMVGFNRRFSPHGQIVKDLLSTVTEPKTIVITVNAGQIPADHWTQDLAVGGGRIVGEACHFIDFARFLIGHRITAHNVAVVRPSTTVVDNVSISLQFEDGSIATIHYVSSGHKTFPKERVEVFCSGRVLQLDNFRRLTGWGWPGFRSDKLWIQDKGQKRCVAAFVQALQKGNAGPIPLEEIVEVSRISIEAALEAAR